VKASDFVAHYIKARGVTHVFELVGGMITHLLDSISTANQVKIVSCHHEQGAGFAAEGYARITGIPGVALATSGPGATNLLTAVGSCFFDSTPTVFITGQVNTHELKGERGIRQLGFQETDIVAMASPICKSAVQVKHAEELPFVLDSAFRLALEGRQGPCLVDIPMNVQSEEIQDELADNWLQSVRDSNSDEISDVDLLSDNKHLKQELKSLLEAISQAERPILLMGGGCTAKSNRQAAQQIADQLQLPVVLSLMAVDLLPESHPHRVGFIGSYGNRWANKALGAADFLVVLGSRLDIRQTGSDLDSFCNGKQIWQIDIDSAEIGVRVMPQHSLCCSIQQAADCLAELEGPPNSLHRAWLEWINELRLQFPASLEYATEGHEINPIHLLQKVSSCVSASCNYVTDVGQHQMWAAQSLRFHVNDRFLTSGGMGAMGFGLPAAIGSAIADLETMSILISGDGSFQVNIQELECVKRNNLNLKIIIFNNHCHGMVRQFQESYFNSKLQSTVEGYSAPEFAAVSHAYGIPSRCIASVDEVDEGIRWLLHSKGPVLLEVALSVHSKVYPKLAFGRRFGEMEPEASPVAMEST
jgi:acetolactate synthase I/II/III large subunit